jgi:DNA-directed RNA polymerase subunit RPC12/RpoP
MAKNLATPFDCPNCGAHYLLVRAEADTLTPDRDIACRSCGAPLQGRDGGAVLKYFMTDRPKAQAAQRRAG